MSALVTIILSIILMVGLFLMLIAGVAFVQDKKYFTSAPKDVQKAILPKEERFKGQHVVGWMLMALSIVMILSALILAGADGIRAGFNYWQFYERFVIMLLLLKAFDILFFDWFLLCHSGFYPHFFPETKDLVGPQQFGFNKKSHAIQIILCVVFSFVLAGICRLITAF